MSNWRYYSICPIYGRLPQRGSAQNFYAPTLLDAFAEARGKWPGADAWTCLGSKSCFHDHSAVAQ